MTYLINIIWLLLPIDPLISVRRFGLHFVNPRGLDFVNFATLLDYLNLYLGVIVFLGIGFCFGFS